MTSNNFASPFEPQTKSFHHTYMEMLPQFQMSRESLPWPQKKCGVLGGALDVLLASYENYCGLVDEIERLTGGYFTFIFKIASSDLSNTKIDAMETLAHILLFFQAHKHLLNVNEKLPEMIETLQTDIVEANESIYLTLAFFRRIQRELLSVIQLLCNTAQSMSLELNP